MPDPNLDLLLLQLFDVASSADWSGWLSGLQRFFGAASAALVPLGFSATRWLGAVSVGLANDRQAAYREHFFPLDDWAKRIRAAPVGSARTLQMLVPDDEFHRSEFYNDFMRPAGRRYALGITVEAGGSRFLLGLSRENGDRDFDTDHLRAAERLSGFLARTLRTQRLFQMAEINGTTSEAVLNQSQRGVLLLDANRKVVFANRMAATLLRSEDAVGVRCGELVALDRADERRLRDSLNRVLDQPCEQSILMLSGTRSSESVTAAVTRLPPGHEPDLDLGITSPQLLVVLTEQTHTIDVKPAHLEAVFGFTRQEARTGALLLAGLDLNDIARRLTISRETVRYHLKSLFAKTGTHSQRELVHHMTTTMPPLAPERLLLSGAA